jgi:hypothetical protein
MGRTVTGFNSDIADRIRRGGYGFLSSLLESRLSQA